MSLTRAMSERLSLVYRRLGERCAGGRVPEEATARGPVLVVVDGVGRFQFAPYVLRRVLRDLSSPIEVVMYDWQTPIVGDIWCDLMWHRRNRVMGAQLARRLLKIHRAQPHRPIDLFAYSGGASIGAFACESLRGRRIVNTLLLVAPALSPGFDLIKALRAVNHCSILVSPHDRVVLGLGTTLFGTSDRVSGSAAGRVGFDGMGDLPRGTKPGYDRCWQFRWTETLRPFGHHGGHAGWIAMPFLRRYLLSLLAGDNVLWTDAVGSEKGVVRNVS